MIKYTPFPCPHCQGEINIAIHKNFTFVCDYCSKEYDLNGVDISGGYNSRFDDEEHNFCSEECCVKFLQNMIKNQDQKPNCDKKTDEFITCQVCHEKCLKIVSDHCEKCDKNFCPECKSESYEKGMCYYCGGGE